MGLGLGTWGVQKLEVASHDTSHEPGVCHTLNTCGRIGHLVLLLANNGLHAKDKEGLGFDEVSHKGAIRVLECHNEGQLLLV